MQKIICITLLFLTHICIYAQKSSQYSKPLKIPFLLSSNFGELRPGHFHSGIDIKTQGIIGKPVYSIDRGYISRISVSPYGYGLAIYINHPDGHTSVYGHLSRFTPRIATYVKRQQYKREKYDLNLYLTNKRFPVYKGSLIAYSGNTGGSGGPHVHFELRQTAGQIAIDPLTYFGKYIRDRLSPIFKGIAIYPQKGKGTVNNSSKPLRFEGKCLYQPTDTIYAWGKIGFGMSGVDRMNGTSNIYGIKKIRLYCNDKKIFSTNIKGVNFNKSLMINSFTDFDYWMRHKLFYVKSFVNEGNTLHVYTKLVNNGCIDIKQQKVYQLRYEIEDYYGNMNKYSFTIHGKKQTIKPNRQAGQLLSWDKSIDIKEKKIKLFIPQNSVLDLTQFRLQNQSQVDSLSDVYTLGDKYVTLLTPAILSIRLNKDRLKNKQQYGLISIDNNETEWCNGIYHNGWLCTKITQLGHTYKIVADTISPQIDPIHCYLWKRYAMIKLNVSDQLSGIKSYRGTIDSKFALFEHDCKSDVYLYRFDSKRLVKNKYHKLIFKAVDECGNTSVYKYQFFY